MKAEDTMMDTIQIYHKTGIDFTESNMWERVKPALIAQAEISFRGGKREAMFLLASHYFGSLPDGRDTFAFTQQELLEIRGVGVKDE